MKRTGILTALAILATAMPISAQEVRNDTASFSRQNRFLEKDFPPAKITQSVTILDSFEQDLPATLNDWMIKSVDVRKSDLHSTEGKTALEVKFLEGLGAIAYRPDWKNYWTRQDQSLGCYRLMFSDELRLDIFNPGKPVKLVIRTRDGYLPSWISRSVELKSGANTVSLAREELFRGVFRTGKVLDYILFAVEDDQPVTLYFDNFRLIGPGIGENMIRDAKCFSFGARPMIRPFFTWVDVPMEGHVYTKERAYGWAAAKAGKPKPSDVNWREPDGELIRNNVAFNVPFLVDLPDGKYRLQLVEGYRGYSEPLPGYWDLSIKITDGQAKLMRRGASNIAELARLEYAAELTDWRPGQDKWNAFAADIFRPLECDFEVSGGQAKIELITDPPGKAKVSFMIIYPQGKSAAIEPELAALWRNIRDQYNEVYKPFTREMAELINLPALHEEYLAPEIRRKKKAALAKATSIEKQGYVCFARPAGDEVYPDTIPSPEECSGMYTALGSPGETESLTVGVSAWRDITGAQLQVGDFVSANGGKIPASAADVRIVGYCYRMNAEITHGDWKYMVLPWYLTKRPSIDIPTDTSRRFWINVEIPADAKPGIYKSHATFRGTNVQPQNLELAVEVLPFKLDPVPANKEFCAMFDSYIYDNPLDAKITAAYGNPSPDASARVKAIAAEAAATKDARIKANFALARKCGFTTVNQAKPPAGIDTGSLKIVNHLAKADANSDPSPQIKIIGSLQSQSEDTISAAKKTGAKAMLNGLMNLMVFQEGNLYRFQNGFLLWRLGGDGAVCGPWQFYFGDPYQPFDGHKGEPGWFAAYASTDWPSVNPALILQGAAEGIKDYRYLAMLERLAAEKSATPASREAQEYLASLRREVRPAAAYYFTFIRFRDSGPSWACQKETAWKGADFAAQRRKIVEMIKKLKSK